MKNDVFTFEDVSEVFEYCPDTGLIHWKKGGTGRKRDLSAGVLDVCNRYINISYKHVNFKAHRLAWLLHYGEWPSDGIDHINGVRDDNRIENLRVVSNSDNIKNSCISSANTSGVTGVSWNKVAKKWHVQIKSHGVSENIGLFKDKDDAIKARKDAEIRHNFHPNHGRPVCLTPYSL